MRQVALNGIANPLVAAMPSRSGTGGSRPPLRRPPVPRGTLLQGSTAAASCLPGPPVPRRYHAPVIPMAVRSPPLASFRSCAGKAFPPFNGWVLDRHTTGSLYDKAAPSPAGLVLEEPSRRPTVLCKTANALGLRGESQPAPKDSSSGPHCCPHHQGDPSARLTPRGMAPTRHRRAALKRGLYYRALQERPPRNRGTPERGLASASARPRRHCGDQRACNPIQRHLPHGPPLFGVLRGGAPKSVFAYFCLTTKVGRAAARNSPSFFLKEKGSKKNLCTAPSPRQAIKQVSPARRAGRECPGGRAQKTAPAGGCPGDRKIPLPDLCRFASCKNRTYVLSCRGSKLYRRWGQ